MVLLLGACGSSTEERAATGGIGGVAAGAAVGGPVGAVVGGAGGAYAGSTLDEGVEQKIPEMSGSTGTEGAATGTGQSSTRRAAYSGHAELDRREVRNVQQALRRDGFNIAVDGIWGPKTQGALREFQQNRGLEATGDVNAQTMAALEDRERQNRPQQDGEQRNEERRDDAAPADTTPPDAAPQ